MIGFGNLLGIVDDIGIFDQLPFSTDVCQPLYLAGVLDIDTIDNYAADCAVVETEQ